MPTFAGLLSNIGLFPKVLFSASKFRCGIDVSFEDIIRQRDERARLSNGNLTGSAPLTDRNPEAHRSALRQFYLGRLVFFEKLFSAENFRECFPLYEGALDSQSRLAHVGALLSSTSSNAEKTRVFAVIETQLRRLHTAPRRASIVPETPSTAPCSVDFFLRDAAQLVHDCAAQGVNVFVQDAANAQRLLGAATYQSGTLEERLAQNTSLFEDSLPFITLMDGQEGRVGGPLSLAEKATAEAEVLEHKAALLHLIYETLRLSLIAPEEAPWVSNANYTRYLRHFFGAEAPHLSFFGFLQNRAYELPPGSGHVVSCLVFDPQNLRRERLSPDVANTALFPCTIAQVAAVDQRRLGGYIAAPGAGLFDYACSSDPQYQRLAHALRTGDRDLPHIMNRNSIQFTIESALASGAPIILLNLFGCGAFSNDPAQIAALFREVLLENARALTGKHIVFFGLPGDTKNLNLVRRVLAPLNDSGFSLSQYPTAVFEQRREAGERGVVYEIVPIKAAPDSLDGACCLISEHLKSTSLGALGKAIAVPDRPAHGNIEALVNAYSRGLARLPGPIKHTILLGTGRHGWSVSESIQALAQAQAASRECYTIKIHAPLDEKAPNYLGQIMAALKGAAGITEMTTPAMVDHIARKPLEVAAVESESLSCSGALAR